MAHVAPCRPPVPQCPPREARGRPEGAEGAPPPPTIYLRLRISIQYGCRRFILHVCVGRAGRLWCSFLTQVLFLVLLCSYPHSERARRVLPRPRCGRGGEAATADDDAAVAGATAAAWLAAGVSLPLV